VRIGTLEEAKDEIKVIASTHDARLIELERTVDKMSERNTHYEGKIDLMDKSIQILGEKQETLKERMPSKDEWQEIKQGIRDIQGRDGKSFSRIKDIIITVVLSGAITYFLTKLLESIASKGGTP
jgi:chromosome segregation ATPase